MRYTRLRRAIENGTLIGTHGTPFQGGAAKISEAQRKRKRPLRSALLESGEIVPPRATRSGGVGYKREKVENDSTDEYDTDFSSEDEKMKTMVERMSAPKRNSTTAEEEALRSVAPILREDVEQQVPSGSRLPKTLKFANDANLDFQMCYAAGRQRRKIKTDVDQPFNETALKHQVVEEHCEDFKDRCETGLKAHHLASSVASI